MQEMKPKQEEKKNARERAYLAGLKTVACWRGYGGVARGRRLRAALLLLTVAKKFFLLPYPSFFFRSQWLSVLGLVLVSRFRFPSFWFAYVLPSLSSFGSLLLTVSVFFLFFFPPFCSVFSSYL